MARPANTVAAFQHRVGQPGGSDLSTDKTSNLFRTQEVYGANEDLRLVVRSTARFSPGRCCSRALLALATSAGATRRSRCATRSTLTRSTARGSGSRLNRSALQPDTAIPVTGWTMICRTPAGRMASSTHPSRRASVFGSIRGAAQTSSRSCRLAGSRSPAAIRASS